MVIGLTGPNAAGKGEVARWLVSRGFLYHSLSDVLREELERLDKPATRENMIALGNEMRAAEGPGALVARIGTRLSGSDVVDSIRNPSEVLSLRKLPGFILVGVAAPVELRFARSQARGRPGDGATLEEFVARESRENSSDPHHQQLARTFAMVDHTIANDGSLEQLQRRASELLERLTAAARH